MEQNEGVVFDINGDLNPGTWFDMTGGGRICVRVCDGDSLRDFRKRTTKKRIEYKAGQRFVIEDVDEDAMSALIWDYCIFDWERFFDKDGNAIPCTKENKNKLIGKSMSFAKFIGEKLDELTNIIAEEKEASEKN